MISYFAIYSIVKFRLKEFAFEYHYTILAPIINNLLFVLIFSTIDKYYSLSINNISFIEFLIPGLIIMIVAQESKNDSTRFTSRESHTLRNISLWHRCLFRHSRYN